MNKSKDYIRGWKQLSVYTGFHPRTLQDWHLTRAPLPFIKTHPASSRSRWVTTPEMVRAWFCLIGVSGVKK